MSQTRILCPVCGFPQAWCQCPPPAATAPDASVFSYSWKERTKEARERGEMIGMLQGVRFLVDAGTKMKIEELLARIGEF